MSDYEAHYRDRADAVAAAVASLPPAARGFVAAWRPHVERLGRCGPRGCALSAVEEFVAAVAELCDGLREGLPAGEATGGD